MKLLLYCSANRWLFYRRPAMWKRLVAGIWLSCGQAWADRRYALYAIREQSIPRGALDMARAAEVFEVGEGLGDGEAPVVDAA